MGSLLLELSSSKNDWVQELVAQELLTKMLVQEMLMQAENQILVQGLVRKLIQLSLQTTINS